MNRITLATFVAALACLAGCQRTVATHLPKADAAYAVIPSRDNAPPQQVYEIGSDDVLRVQIFNEPELSQPEIRVDDAGNINLPLVGTVRAAGKTATALSGEIESLYRQRYLRNPSVVVGIKTAARRIVTVEGEVKMPGVYEIEGPYTLVSAIARAQSPTAVAKLDEVMIFRQVEGQRVGGVFDLAAIRAGVAPDPQILPGDVVVVGYSQLRGTYRDFIQLAPVLNLLRPY